MPRLTKQTHHLLYDDEQAIVALCTPRGSGALALIRVSGKNALDVVSSLAKLSSGQELVSVPTHSIHHGYVVDHRKDNQCIDEVLFFVMHAPKTFTGQDTVEISCHNNQFIIEHIIDCAVSHGARPARAGEFSRRAFINNKIDLIQAEAINDLIGAQTELALRHSMAMVQGSLSHGLHQLEEKLVELLSYIEAGFEFLDEEQRDFDFKVCIQNLMQKILGRIDEFKANFAQQKQIKEGIRIALLGVVNAGKSTLFNALVKKERAIVAEIAGTTRDSIETCVYHKGSFWLIIDTAGIRQTNEVIEQKSIQRSFQEAATADIILLVFDSTKLPTKPEQEQYQALVQQYQQKIIAVVNKIDACTELVATNIPGFDQLLPTTVHVSAKNHAGIQNLEQLIEQKIQTIFAQCNSPYLLNQRQFKLLTEIELDLKFIANRYSDGLDYEVVAHNLKNLLEKVSELTGKNVTEKILDMIFDEFCVGK